MKRRHRNAVVLSVAAVLAVAAAIGVLFWSNASRVPDPVYQGKRLSVWLRTFDAVSLGYSAAAQTEAQNAIRQLGTNAVPRLIWMLQARDSALKTKLMWLLEKQPFIKVRFNRAMTLNNEALVGIFQLAHDNRNGEFIPELVKFYDQEPSSASRQAICSFFFVFADDAAPAVPSIVRQLRSPNELERNGAINTLRRIRAYPTIVVPALINTLRDPSPRNQADAAYALAVYGTYASAAVEPLLALLNHPARSPNSGMPVADISAAVNASQSPASVVPLVTLLNDPTRNPNSGMPFVNIHAAVQFALEHIDPATAAKIFWRQK